MYVGWYDVIVCPNFFKQKTIRLNWPHLLREGALLGNLGYRYDDSGQLVKQVGSLAPEALPAASNDNQFDDNNRQLKANGTPQTYDADGHLLSDGKRNYIWNDRDQLEQITEGSNAIASFRYDALGRRIAKSENGSTTEYLYDGPNAVQETQNGKTNSILTGLSIDQRFARDDVNGRTYFLTDHLNSTRLLTDASGNVVQRYDYDPYGVTTQSSNGFTNPYQYTGREKDSSGLYYYRARYYQPVLSQFISEDPIGLNGAINSFSYGLVYPNQTVDPSGLDIWLVNRDLAIFGSSARSRNNPITHTFIAHTDFNGTVDRTYSWGNDANLKGWNLNQLLDMRTANDAISKGLAEHVSDSTFDPYVEKAYEWKNKNKDKFEHVNGIIYNNCKTEANGLLDFARFIQSLYPSEVN